MASFRKKIWDHKLAKIAGESTSLSGGDIQQPLQPREPEVSDVWVENFAQALQAGISHLASSMIFAVKCVAQDKKISVSHITLVLGPESFHGCFSNPFQGSQTNSGPKALEQVFELFKSSTFAVASLHHGDFLFLRTSRKPTSTSLSTFFVVGEQCFQFGALLFGLATAP